MHYISIRLCLVLGRNREHSHNPFFPQPILRRPWTFFFPLLFIPLPNHVFGMFFLAVLSLLLIPLLKLPVYQKSVFICYPLFARFPPNLSFLLVLKLKRIVSSSVSSPFSIPTFPFLSISDVLCCMCIFFPPFFQTVKFPEPPRAFTLFCHRAYIFVQVCGPDRLMLYAP